MSKNTEKMSCLKFKANVVYGDCVLPGKILRHSSEERLGEVKAREPEDCRWAVIYPVLSKQTSKHTYSDVMYSDKHTESKQCYSPSVEPVLLHIDPVN